MDKLIRTFSTKKSNEKSDNKLSTKNKEIILAENFDKELQDWKLPEISKSTVYKKGSFEFKSDYIIKTIEETIPLKGGYDSFNLLSEKLIKYHQQQKFKFLHVGLVQIGIKPLTRDRLNVCALTMIRDERHLGLEDYCFVLLDPFSRDYQFLLYRLLTVWLP